MLEFDGRSRRNSKKRKGKNSNRTTTTDGWGLWVTHSRCFTRARAQRRNKPSFPIGRPAALDGGHWPLRISSSNCQMRARRSLHKRLARETNEWLLDHKKKHRSHPHRCCSANYNFAMCWCNAVVVRIVERSLHFRFPSLRLCAFAISLQAMQIYTFIKSRR